MALLAEPDNPVDRDAIAVHCAAGQVGYLDRELAQDFKAVMRQARRDGYDGLSCIGLLEGGTRARPRYGVVLALSYPKACERHLGIDGRRTRAGAVRGRHYSDHADDVRQLRREGREDEAEALLLELLDATEREAADHGEGWGVAPWYYEQLAIIYRGRKDAASEVRVLERYAAQPHGPGVGPTKLKERLEKAHALAMRSSSRPQDEA